MLDDLLTGTLTGASLIVAIGAQNAYVLRRGIARDHVGLVVAICAISDLALIAAGVAGVGALVADHPTALRICTWLGAAYLVWFAIGSFRSAVHPAGLAAACGSADQGTDRDADPTPTSSPEPGRLGSRLGSRLGNRLGNGLGNGPGRVAATTLALTWLNPHVYLDTVLMLGNLAASRGPNGRWWFALGAGLASIVWFSALGFGARVLAPWVARPWIWRVIDVVIGVMMLAIAVALIVTAPR